MVRALFLIPLCAYDSPKWIWAHLTVVGWASFPFPHRPSSSFPFPNHPSLFCPLSRQSPFSFPQHSSSTSTCLTTVFWPLLFHHPISPPFFPPSTPVFFSPIPPPPLKRKSSGVGLSTSEPSGLLTKLWETLGRITAEKHQWWTLRHSGASLFPPVVALGPPMLVGLGSSLH